MTDLDQEHAFFATAAKGTEPAVRDELRELRFRKVRADRGGVHFRGSLLDGARACLLSRCAVRILWLLTEIDAPDGDALYEGIGTIDWDAWISAEQTIAVRATSKNSSLTHTQFIAQRTKDGVVDQLRNRTGARPSVELRDPDVGIAIHLVKNRASVYLDLSGEPLHRRGYRAPGAPAPLKETLAASIIRMSGWQRDTPFIDPMCGSGTLAIEAAMWAAGVAPSVLGRRYTFERWAFQNRRFNREIRDLRSFLQDPKTDGHIEIQASDIDKRSLQAVEISAAKLGVTIHTTQRDIADLSPPHASGQLVTNPPYGARVERGPDLLDELGRALKRMSGYEVAVLAGTPDVPRAIPMRAHRSHDLQNGPIDCRLMLYQVR